MKPFAESSEQNKQAILEVLKRSFTDISSVLEIGSGTGQHAVFFAEQFPDITWYASDQAEYLNGIQMWINEAGFNNLVGPLLLDVDQPSWPVKQIEGIFSANTVHIMSWHNVQKMFSGISEVLSRDGVFCLYGPFNYNGKFTSESNARFDLWLKQRDPLSGVRDFEALQNLAKTAGLTFTEDNEMPANNRLLVWTKD